jgi:hypothetical protein
MKLTRGADLLFNVIIPFLLGTLVYFASSFSLLQDVLSNHLPDGLWAYAFISSLLIIWDRQAGAFWISIAFLVATCFEMLQYYHIIDGTGDVYDIAIYYLFFGIALLLNNSFKTFFKQRS